ncbi:NUMOD4 domain-containing protein [Sphingomonas oryzagri]|uniref:NUMOD4 domain-containing protein n=1 Tax=Sphingomonas oryzagri TaxID=3042314 RepID=A0ABT6N2F9_9SPHN|nr:NUMOD4 domain-containing protein [Sphingomonas oryzagri]MDH7638973.1 NUMOD4 domain-containing protein [Sphingomonas oryzagri]
MEEKWKQLPGFEGLYSVSSLGAVKRHARVLRNGRGIVNSPERLIEPTLSRGYLLVNLWRDNRPTRFLVHRLVMLAFAGASDFSVDHLNGDKTDNSLKNLEYVSLSENTARQHSAGRAVFVRGESNGKAKLTAESALTAKQLLASGLSSRLVGMRLGVSKGAIQALREGRTWGHITIEPL